jgi:rhomboid family GlyGly-CTERM serine protease
MKTNGHRGSNFIRFLLFCRFPSFIFSLFAMMHRFPCLTAAIAGVAVLAFLIPVVGEALIYDRGAILRGQLWRLWTCHAVHFSASHLAWNLAVLLAAGGWLERLVRRQVLGFYLVAPAIVAGTLFLFDPALARYGGLSGLAAGLVVGLALHRCSVPGEPRAVWWAVLAVVALKIGVEWRTGAPLLSDGIRVVPLAHVAGIAAALVFLRMTTQCGSEPQPKDGSDSPPRRESTIRHQAKPGG